MKQILTLLAGILLLTACDCGCYNWKDAPFDTALWLGDEYWKASGPTDPKTGEVNKIYYGIRKLNYKGHHYLQMYTRQPGYDDPMSGIVHDPDCPACKKEATVNSEYESIFGGGKENVLW